MLCTVYADELESVIAAIESGRAVKVEEACFLDGLEKEIRVDFFRLDDKVIRRCYYGRTTITTYEYVLWGEDRDLFEVYYPQKKSQSG